VEEQSHKDEMRAALRGDFERMRQRQEAGSEPSAPGARRAPVPPAEPRVVEKGLPSESWLARLLGRA
jgi:hypothetical protein